MTQAPTRLLFRQQDLDSGHAVADAIRTMAAEAAERLGIPEAARAIRHSALQREEEESTYLGKGLAVPHARVPQLEQAAVYVAHSAAGVPWPEEKAHVITLLIVPEEKPELHLHLLSRIVRARMEKGAPNRLSPDDLEAL